MNIHMKLSEILMDELPQEHPWKGNVRGLVERLIANGVTFAKDTNVLTNADRIRAMSDEELADFLESTHTNMEIKLGGEYILRAKEYIEMWLEQPAEK